MPPKDDAFLPPGATLLATTTRSRGVHSWRTTVWLAHDRTHGALVIEHCPVGIHVHARVAGARSVRDVDRALADALRQCPSRPDDRRVWLLSSAASACELADELMMGRSAGRRAS